MSSVGLFSESEENHFVDEDEESKPAVNENCFMWTSKLTTLLVQKRLGMQRQFAESGSRSKQWIIVYNQILDFEPNLEFTIADCRKKFANLLVTYNRIKRRHTKDGKHIKHWIFFDAFDKVFGTKCSLEHLEENSYDFDRTHPRMNRHEKQTSLDLDTNATRIWAWNPMSTILLVKTRLAFAKEFERGTKSRSTLWNIVYSNILENDPDFKFSCCDCRKKFANMLVSYNRIMRKNKANEIGVQPWPFFEDFHQVYGHKYSFDEAHSSVEHNSECHSDNSDFTQSEYSEYNLSPKLANTFTQQTDIEEHKLLKQSNDRLSGNKDTHTAKSFLWNFMATKQLLETRLGLEHQFANVRKSQTTLWNTVHSHILLANPYFEFSCIDCRRKFENMIETYNRIKKNKEKTIQWPYFNHFEKVYGNKYISPPTPEGQEELEEELSDSANSNLSNRKRRRKGTTMKPVEFKIQTKDKRYTSTTKNSAWSFDLIKLMLSARLGLENQFADGSKSRATLWNVVHNQILAVKPNLVLSATHCMKKFYNLLVTYKRIKYKNSRTNEDNFRQTKSWPFFDDFNEVYGNNKYVKLEQLDQLREQLPECSNGSSPKIKESRLNEDIINYWKQEDAKEQKRHEERIKLLKEKNDIEKEKIKCLQELINILQNCN